IGYALMQPVSFADDRDPLAHVRDHGRARGKYAVGHKAAHILIIGGSEESGAATFADAEEADSLGVRIVAALEVGQRRLGITHFQVCDPLKRFVARMRTALPLAPRFVGEDIEAAVDQEMAVIRTGPAIGA